MTVGWTGVGDCCLGDLADYKVDQRRTQFAVYIDRFMD